MNLWLDDDEEERIAPEGWLWAKTVAEAKEILDSVEIERASLDHDLGDPEAEGRHLVLWMCELNIWPTEGIDIHSGNVVGVKNMSALIERYGPYGKPSPDLRHFSR